MASDGTSHDPPPSPIVGAMTMNPVELERKVRLVDDEVQSIYVMLARIQGTQERHTNRLNELAARLDVVNEELGSRLDAVESRLDQVLDLLRGRRG